MLCRIKSLKYFSLVFFIVLISCNKNTNFKTKEDINFNYQLDTTESGLIVEKFHDSIFNINQYNDDNVIYKVGSVFSYRFKHLTNSNTKYYFIKDRDAVNGWSFVEENYEDINVVKSVNIVVLDGNPMANNIADYNQTNLKYLYLDDYKNYSMSGAIENKANVWIHPPRDYYFRILELNPFPYIKTPYQVGNSWTWNLGIGEGWGDERWMVWEGSIENLYNYKIIDKKYIDTKLGKLECYIIESTAKSRIGKTKLLSYFNLKYGFVKLDYTNIDGSKTLLELDDYSIINN